MDEITAKHLHLRDHLTDGNWHDSCPWCRRRRIHGGNGTERHCRLCGRLPDECRNSGACGRIDDPDHTAEWPDLWEHRV